MAGESLKQDKIGTMETKTGFVTDIRYTAGKVLESIDNFRCNPGIGQSPFLLKRSQSPRAKVKNRCDFDGGQLVLDGVLVRCILAAFPFC